MIRLFDEHLKRKVKILDGAWMAEADPKGDGEARGLNVALSDPHRVTVPSVWNTEMPMLEYEGVVFYEKQIYTDGGTVRFRFGAVMTAAKVFLDGEFLGEHYGGFSEFSFIKRDVAAMAEDHNRQKQYILDSYLCRDRKQRAHHPRVIRDIRPLRFQGIY